MKKIKIKKEVVFSKGSIAVFALFLMFILTVTTLGIIAAASVERKSSMSTGSSITAFQVAEKGMETVEKHFKDNFYEQINTITIGICSSESIRVNTMVPYIYKTAATINSSNLKIRFKDKDSEYISSCNAPISSVKIIKVIGKTKNETRTIEQDVFFGATKLLLHLDGKNSNIKFDDSSYYYESFRNGEIELQGQADSDSSVKKFGPGSAKFDGIGDSLIVKVGGFSNHKNEDFYFFEEEDFTIDFWVRPTAFPSSPISLVAQKQNSTNKFWSVDLDNNLGKIRFWAKDGGPIFDILSSNSLSVNNWNHIAAVRKDNEIKLFINGNQSGNITYSGSMPNFINTDVTIGSTGNPVDSSLKGNMDEVRISKGIARFWNDFHTSLPSNPYWAD